MVNRTRSSAAVSEAMDQAGREASEELNAAYLESDEARKAVDYVAAWWRKHYLRAGHKRLARVLLEYAPRKS